MGDGLKVYDASEVSLVVASIPIDSGFADGDFVKIEQDSDDYGDKVGTDGEVTRFSTGDRRATVTVMLMQSSSSNAVLSALNNLDVNAKGGAGIGTFLLRDRQGTSLYNAAKCWIQKPPEVVFGREPGPREWKFRLANLKRLDGGN